MAAKIISGTEVAKQIREELAREVALLKEKYNVVPGLVTILVGENPASVSYVTGKKKTAKELAFYSIQDSQPANIPEEKLLELIDRYNKDPKIHGILLQLPLPGNRDGSEVFGACAIGVQVGLRDQRVIAGHRRAVGRLVLRVAG